MLAVPHTVRHVLIRVFVLSAMLHIKEQSIQVITLVIVILAIMMMEAMQYVLNAHMNVPPVKYLILTV